MKRRRWGVLVVAIAALAWASASAQAIGRQLVRSELNQVVDQMAGYGIPGGVIGVTGGRAGGYQRAFGIAAPGQPMALNDHFRVGSISKTFTATVILELVDRGALHLNDRLSRWEPSIPNASRITIRMLLDMRSGIWDEGGDGPDGQTSNLGLWLQQNCKPKNPTPECGMYWAPQHLINLAIQQGKPAYAPGQVYYYSDTNYMILALIAQKLTHKPFGVLMKHMVFDPLHLRQTSFPTHRSSLPGPATIGYQAIPSSNPTSFVPGAEPSPSIAYGAGNVVSTLHDLRIWVRALGTGALLRSGTQRVRLRMAAIGGELLPLPSFGLTTGLPLSYGLGIASAGSMLGHNGALDPPGYSAEAWYVPRARGTVVVLLNNITSCTGGFLSDAAASTLAMLTFGQPLEKASLPGFAGAVCETVG
jgi:D-alanyl-D-alanine carboxypeptidase